MIGLGRISRQSGTVIATPARPTTILVSLPIEFLSTGVWRRVDHLVSHYGLGEGGVRVVALRPRPTKGWRPRFLALRRALQLRRELSPNDVVHLAGFMSPSMNVLAVLFYLSGHRSTRLDACDSWRLIKEFAGSSDDLQRTAKAGRLTLRMLPPGIAISYVSRRDLSADHRNGGSRRLFVIPPSVPEALRELPPIDAAHISRFIVCGDLGSDHLRHGLDVLSAAWPLHIDSHPDSWVDIYGANTDQVCLGPRSAVHGFVADMADIYRGPSAAILLNGEGSGVPNKLNEAIAARRPIVAHTSVLQFVRPHPWVVTYHDVASMTQALSQMRSLNLESNVHPPELLGPVR